MRKKNIKNPKKIYRINSHSEKKFLKYKNKENSILDLKSNKVNFNTQISDHRDILSEMSSTSNLNKFNYISDYTELHSRKKKAKIFDDKKRKVKLIELKKEIFIEEKENLIDRNVNKLNGNCIEEILLNNKSCLKSEYYSLSGSNDNSLLKLDNKSNLSNDEEKKINKKFNKDNFGFSYGLLSKRKNFTKNMKEEIIKETNDNANKGIMAYVSILKSKCNLNREIDDIVNLSKNEYKNSNNEINANHSNDKTTVNNSSFKKNLNNNYIS